MKNLQRIITRYLNITAMEAVIPLGANYHRRSCFLLKGHIALKATLGRWIPIGLIFLSALFELVPIVLGQDKLPELSLQSGHLGRVDAVTFSPDGRILASAGSDHTIKLWDTLQGLLVRTLVGHSDKVRCVAFSPDGKSLVSGSNDHTIRIWELQSGRSVRSIAENPKFWVTGVAYSADGRTIISVARLAEEYTNAERLPNNLGVVRVLDVATGRTIRSMETDGFCNSFAVSPASTLVFGLTGQLWDAGTGKLVSKDGGIRQGANRSAAFSPNGNLLALVGSYGLDIWDTKRLVEIHRIRDLYLNGVERIQLTSVTFGPDGDSIAAGDESGRVGLWDASSGSNRQLVEAPSKWQQDEISAIAFSPDGKTLAAAHESGKIRMWEVKNGLLDNVRDFQAQPIAGEALASSANDGSQLRTSRGNAIRITAVRFSPDGRSLAIGGIDAKIRVWNLRNGRLATTLEGHPGSIRELAFSPDMESLISISGGDPRSGTLRLWKTGNWKLERTYEAHMVSGATFHPDGRNVAWVGSGAYLLDLTTDLQRRVCSPRGAAFPGFATLSADGKKGAIGVSIGRTDKEEICLFDAATGEQVRTLAGHPDLILSGAFSPDSQTLITSGRDRMLKLWDVKSGRLIRTLAGHAGEVRATAFSQSGTMVASGSADQAVKLWDPRNGKLIRTLNGHSAEVTSLAFGPEGRTIASGSEDGTTRVWSTDTGNLLLTLVTFDDDQWIAYSPEGYYIASDQGSKYVTWRVGNTVYEYDQFFEKFYTPDLVVSIFQGKDLTHVSLPEKTAPPPPDVLIRSPRPGQLFTEPEIDLALEVKDLGGGVDEVRLYQNGKQVSSTGVARGVGVTAVGSATSVRNYRLTLVEGDNVLRATAYNRDRTESRPHEITVQLRAPKKEAALRLLAVGISRYKNPALSLGFPKLDATDLVSFFKTSGSRLFREVDVTQLVDEAATQTNILQSLQSLQRRALPEDVVIIFLAGHGGTVSNEWYFIPHELSEPEKPDELAAHGISSDQLAQELKRISSHKVLLLMDACYSGSMLSAFRGYEDRKTLMLLARSVGVHILAASARDQRASEVTELRHGVFSYLLLKGLNGEAVLRGAEKRVTVLSLVSYIRDQLPDLGRRYKTEIQDPVIYSNGMDFPLVVVP